MNRLVLIALLGVGACAPASHMFGRGPRPNENVEAQYTRAMTLLAPGASLAALDSATLLLDAYLAHSGYIAHRSEAAVMRRLAGDAVQLSKVATALQQERAADRTKTDAPARSDGDSLKEIQRLKDELAAANAELERIRKRLATQKP